MTASEFLIHGLETTFWVSLLIILALSLRGPVTARFGSRAAILLWSLPALRLFAPTVTRRETIEVPSPTDSAPLAPTGENWTFEPQPVANPEPGVRDAVMTYAGPVEETPALAQFLPMFRELITAEVLASLVLSLWFLGVVVALALCAGRAASWRKTLLAESADVPEALARMAEDAADRVGTKKNFTLVVSGAADTPQLMGFRKPLLALPVDFAERYDEEEQEMALLHELIHLRRHDLSVLLLSEISFALQWFNPLTRHARKALRADQEAACDEAVRDLGVSTKGYAELLLKAASIGRPVPALTLDHSLKERIVRMQNPLGTPFRRYAFILTAGVSALAVAGFTASSTTVTEYVHPEKEAAKEKDGFDKVEDKEWERFLAEIEDEETVTERELEIALERLADKELQLEDKIRVLRVEGLSDKERAKLEKKLEAARKEMKQERKQLEWRSEESRERRDQARARAEAAIERARERAREDSSNVFFSGGRDGGELRRIEVRVGRGKGESIDLIIDPEGKLLNADELEDFARENDIDIDVFPETDGEVGFDLDTGGKNVFIGKAQPLRFASRDGEAVAVVAGLAKERGDRAAVLRRPGEKRTSGDETYGYSFSDGDRPVVVDLGGGDSKVAVLVPKGERKHGLRLHNDDHADRIGLVDHDGHKEMMVLLTDPFEGLKVPPVVAPKAPKVEIKAPKLETRETEEGTWILIPDEPDMTEFEVAMEAFGEEMEAFGERMEAWGAKMEVAGEALEELADECADHQEESDKPIILSERIEGGKRIRAVCATGGRDRFASEEMLRFIERQGLSREEKKHYKESLRLQR
ncbi:M56 family metallopeptidase [Parvularcula lutaonensis]|uniref:M56 family metallopeptidase n=1 Tax=Parvularcula lutaonensis TaxID=491923 RepID=A0ABV7M9Q8_9PROT|nr:M56 family metallopeptidase [Parvularcula lutaonensis]GGY43130.1 hypothetical protein GCM10007148_09800 [Parvularcula lutaonensis]